MGGGESFTFDIKDMEEMESLALSTSNRIISAIEVAVSSYEAAGEKPAELKPRILRLKAVHEALSLWERNTILSRAKSSMDARVSQLRRFAEILRHPEV
jgi:hypothetical protein